MVPAVTIVKAEKTGKVVGEAKAERAAAKAAKREAKLSRFKEKHGARIDKDISRVEARASKTSAKLESKFQNVKAKYEAGKMSAAKAERKMTEIQYEYMNREFKSNIRKGTLALEKSRLKDYTYADMKKENRDVVVNDVVSIGASAASVGIANMAGLPFGAVAIPNHRGVRRSSRLAGVDKEQVKRMNSEARDNAIKSGNEMVRRNIKHQTVVISPETSKKNNNITNTKRDIYSQGFSKSEKAKAMSEARNKDRYENDFLEAVQNKGIIGSKNNKKLQSEYSKYLDNPKKYWEVERYKLPDE